MSIQFKSYLFAIIAGAIYYYLVLIFWGYFPSFNPFFNWLLDCCAASAWFRPIVLFQDVVINVLLAIPLAWLLLRLNSERIWWCVLLALLPGFIYMHYHLFSWNHSLVDYTKFVPGWAMELLSLPVAVFLVRVCHRRQMA